MISHLAYKFNKVFYNFVYDTHPKITLRQAKNAYFRLTLLQILCKIKVTYRLFVTSCFVNFSFKERKNTMRKSTKRIITLVLAIATLTGMLNAFSATVSAAAAAPNLGNGSFVKIHEWAISEGRNSGDFASAVTFQYWLDSEGYSIKDEGALFDSEYFSAANGRHRCVSSMHEPPEQRKFPEKWW